MIIQLTEVPANMVAFSAEGEVTESDFTQVVIPAVERLVTRTGELNYLMVVNTPISSFKPGAWLQDILMGLQQLTRWNRVAILSDSDSITTFTNVFSILVPGEFKGYAKHEMDTAVKWVSEGK